jgi:hypothetical protein
MSRLLIFLVVVAAIAHADEPASEPTTLPATLPVEPASEPTTMPTPGETITIHEETPPEAASSIHLDQQALQSRPHTTPSDLLRGVPGFVVAQHAGGGKADQLFLRGFDADHGTDVAIFVDGVPANMPSHGHGQGYADTHWLIPETVASIDAHKGPYSARFGDFYTAGAVEMKTIDHVDGLQLQLTGGTEFDGPAAFRDPTYRIVALTSPRFAGGDALIAGEMFYTDGPFENPQRFRRMNLLGKWSGDAAGGTLTVATTAYTAGWNASGQIPARAVDDGMIGRFGSIDPTEGGQSSRASASVTWERGGFRAQTFIVDYNLRLFSDFTLFARDPVNGDEIEQDDARTIYGVDLSYARRHPLGVFSVGAQARADDVAASLWHDAARVRLSDCFSDGVNPCIDTNARIRDLSLWAEDDAQLRPWLRAIAGVRGDFFTWNVDDLNPRTVDTPQTTAGVAQSAIVSPKLSLVGIFGAVQLFANAGTGFHSNDARAAVQANGGGALAQAAGAEIGARLGWRRVKLAAALWYLHLSSEQVWNGDEGTTEPAGATVRYGLDTDAVWEATPWLSVDANVEIAHASFVANAGNGNALALAPKLLGGGGVTFHRGGTMIALRGRGIGPRPANDSNTLTADGYFILDLVAAETIGRWRFGLTIDNLLDSAWREAQFAETSRLPGEPAPVEDVHFTPGTPFVAYLTVGFQL